MSQTGTDPVLVSALISAFGPLVLKGNWTTGYTFTYSYHSELNVTVQYASPSSYRIINFAARNFTISNLYWSISYDATQQKAISIAMANASVKSYLAQYPSYAGGVFFFPAGNKTFGGDYLVLLDQLSGAKTLGAFVNMSSGAVVSTYRSSRALRTCYSSGYCYTSPWGS